MKQSGPGVQGLEPRCLLFVAFISAVGETSLMAEGSITWLPKLTGAGGTDWEVECGCPLPPGAHCANGWISQPNALALPPHSHPQAGKESSGLEERGCVQGTSIQQATPVHLLWAGSDQPQGVVSSSPQVISLQVWETAAKRSRHPPEVTQHLSCRTRTQVFCVQGSLCPGSSDAF